MIQNKFWAGTPESLRAQFLKLATFDLKNIESFTKKQASEASSKLNLKPYVVKNGKAIININGPLTNDDNPFMNWLFGETSYASIQREIDYAKMDKDVKKTILHIDSPGGVVNGMEGVVAAVKEHRAVKPIISFTDGQMDSAAYAIGSAGDGVYITPMAECGSVGVISIHQDFTKYFEEMGIKNTVIRDGEHKALGMPYEELTDEAREILKKEIKQLRGIFAANVAENRKMSLEAVIDTKSETFIGEEAVKIGFADGIATLTQLLTSNQTKEVSFYMENETTKRVAGLEAKVNQLDTALKNAVDLNEQYKKRIAALETDKGKLADKIAKLEEKDRLAEYERRIDATNLTPARKTKSKEIIGKMQVPEAIEALIETWEAEPEHPLTEDAGVGDKDETKKPKIDMNAEIRNKAKR